MRKLYCVVIFLQTSQNVDNAFLSRIPKDEAIFSHPATIGFAESLRNIGEMGVESGNCNASGLFPMPHQFADETLQKMFSVVLES